MLLTQETATDVIVQTTQCCTPAAIVYIDMLLCSSFMRLSNTPSFKRLKKLHAFAAVIKGSYLCVKAVPMCVATVAFRSH